MTSGATHHHSWHVRCLTVPGVDTDLSLYVAFDNVRFLFGCGEGTQRAFVQKRLGWRGLSAIFIPSGSSEGRGGLGGELDRHPRLRAEVSQGLIMTASDANVNKLDIVGPSDISQHIATLRSSINRSVLMKSSYC